MKEKIKNLLLYAGLDKEQNEKYREYVLKQDVKNLSYYLILSGALFFALGISSLVTSGFAQINTRLYLSTAVAIGIIFLLQKLTISRRGDASDVNRIYIFLFMMVLYLESIFLTVMHKDMPAVTYIGVLIILPLLFSQYPIPMIILQVLFVTIFCITSSMFKYPEVAAIDVWNGISFLAVSFVIIVLISPMRFKQIIQPVIIRELSETDMLTGLKNRNSYEAFRRELSRVKKSFFCIYADANGLHELNNEQGHEAGDKMLKTDAAVMKKYFGSENTFRIGGDEFVAFSFDTDAAAVERRMLDAKKELFEAGYHVSVGCAGSESDDEEVDKVVKRAEAGMYADKREYYTTFRKDRRQR